jgi:hypothetical protein
VLRDVDACIDEIDCSIVAAQRGRILGAFEDASMMLPNHAPFSSSSPKNLFKNLPGGEFAFNSFLLQSLECWESAQSL